MPTVIVTGGAGFIGSNLVRHLRRERPDWAIVNVDKLSYAGNLANLEGIEAGPNYAFIHSDVADLTAMHRVWSRARVKYVFHLAAETHVDRSLKDPLPFVRTNVEGTAVLLELARSQGVQKFIHMSTDEVYGAVSEGSAEVFTEESPLRPRNPYAATKAAADLLCQAAHTSHRLPVVIVRPTNNYGPYQHPEKFLPLMITNLLLGEQVPIYGTGRQKRDWLQVDDTCAALIKLAELAEPGSIYNLAGSGLVSNLEVARKVLKLLKLDEERLTKVADRPGHDFSYPLSAKKAREELGIRPTTSLEEGLRRTVLWFQSHESWWRAIREGGFREYYRNHYKEL